ncbi:LacI family DNA-binding transcriptional regulator [Lutibacter sp.]|uniref:LacI family DNA-binding transcriptional regulator n=1 Tax=Lutibacter sp. TaxID=1925666 RepID=UPI0025B99AF1|nr:LacI family DNA-binding transcriptional regulator [Lutibacter sp.]MCF6167240.1 LacI family transcriptional regulator [Lutibacter sp.]
MKKKRIITLRDLAQKLDLSTSTVSRALNNHPDISKLTKDKVKELADELNYTPNIFAKGFRQHKSRTIGVIVPNISHHYTSTIIKGILKESNVKGYIVIVTECNNDFVKQTDLLQTMIKFGVDGILMSVSKMTQNVDDILKTLHNVPIVLFDKVQDKIPCTQILINEEEATFKVVEHLISTNKRRIAIIKETASSITSEKRYAGYLKALRKYNLPIDENIILSTEDINVLEGEKMTTTLLDLDNRPDAIIAITDLAAIGAIKTLKKNNIKIPEEVAVVGFSNSLSSTIIEPNLTTVDQPGQRIGKIAITYLIEEIENESSDIVNKTIEIKTNLIIRGSTIKN